MNDEENFQEQASEWFDARAHDEDSMPPGVANDVAMWSLIAQHLEMGEVVAVPSDFGEQVQRRLRRMAFWKEAAFVAKVGAVTGVLVTLVLAVALGGDWWQRFRDLLNPDVLAQKAQALTPTGVTSFEITKAISHTLPSVAPMIATGFLAVSVLALAGQFLIFRYLGLGFAARKTPTAVHS